MIKMKAITKTYRIGHNIAVNALQGIDIEVKRGEFVAIMGASGSGKSTLMNIIGCLDQQDSGTYELDGLKIEALSDNRLAEIRNKKIGFVFQSYNLLPLMSALGNVELPLIYSGVANRSKYALEVLDRVGLSDRINHKPNELSGGQQQRVSIARALINKPSIILADEPTGNLDSRMGKEIMAIFSDLNRHEGITIVMVTHEPSIGTYAQRIIYLRDGIIEREMREISK